MPTYLTIVLIVVFIVLPTAALFFAPYCMYVRQKRLRRFYELQLNLVIAGFPQELAKFLRACSINAETAESLLLEYQELNKISWLEQEFNQNPGIKKTLVEVLANAAQPLLQGTISENMDVLIGALKTSRFKQTGKVALFTGDLTFEVVDLLFKDKMFDFGILKALESASDLPTNDDIEHFILDEYKDLYRFSEVSSRAPQSFADAILELRINLDVLIAEFSELKRAKETICEWIARGGKPANVVLQ
jgi:hypothetical protein